MTSFTERPNEARPSATFSYEMMAQRLAAADEMVWYATSVLQDRITVDREEGRLSTAVQELDR